ncbi:hypothetical protein evm_009247 [Chilo suppressalis]|nr:hypothetical protein evm_009247 [Chilo suppressalis]
MSQELVEMAIEYIGPDNMLILEPLKDHNYHTSSQSGAEIETNTKTRSRRRDSTTLPKIRKLTALHNCKLCGYSTMKRDVIEAHREMHKTIKPGTKYKCCDTCNINKKVPVGYHKCPQCNFTAKTTSSLKIHMHIHEKGTAYKCTECSFLGRDLKDLANHYKTAKTFCDLCTFSSHLKDKLLAHQKMHSKEKQLVGCSTK